MGKIEIWEKLQKFMENETPFSEEKDVVYFLVEVRKVLDHARRENMDHFRILRFYCDWILHTEKTAITKEIKTILEKIAEEESIHGRGTDTLKSFVDMEKLKNELDFFNMNFGVLSSAMNDETWGTFRKLLIAVLSDQPMIIKGGSGVTRFQFSGNSVIYEIIP